jgi:hypothetical protein
MACGPMTLTPQMLSTAMTLFGQPAGLPQDLSLVMQGTQPEMKLEMICDGGGKATGWTLERYFDTKSATTVVVPLDDGEVDERTTYAHNAADGRVAQKLTVLLDSENKLAQYKVEALCSGINPNPAAPVCVTHVPTVNGLVLGASKGQHADWMQAFVPEVEAGGQYVFVSAAEYPQARKDAEEKKKAANPPPAVPSAVPSVIPSTLPPAAPPPVNPAQQPVAKAENNSEGLFNPLSGGLMALSVILGAATAASLLKLRASRQQNRKLRKRIQALDPNASLMPRARKITSRPNNPHAAAAILRDEIGDEGIPSARERVAEKAARKGPPPLPKAADEEPDSDEMDEVLEELNKGKVEID